ncbi:hypothetical protein L596_023076 [Steinernema carpocapsae]|uniref:Uncharacterized protein n=1 Tax=Steinernema carpocapsae TaxID=34508 RepID=A0A4U5MCT1_STECR|nr:hypothetical protein L596_023076 [Steinernema carpocapsae]
MLCIDKHLPPTNDAPVIQPASEPLNQLRTPEISLLHQPQSLIKLQTIHPMFYSRSSHNLPRFRHRIPLEARRRLLRLIRWVQNDDLR